MKPLLVVLLVVPAFSAGLAVSPGPGDPGKAIYTFRCSPCHGAEGKGDGPGTSLLRVRPRDLTAGKFKFRTTATGSIPADADLERTIREGLPGTAMPAFKEFIAGDSLKALVGFVKSFSARFESNKPKSVSPPPARASANIAAGKKAYDRLECAKCHGADGSGKGAVAADFLDDWGHKVSATDLTEPWTFRGGSAPEDIYFRIRTGIDGSVMPSYESAATEREVWDLANFVASLGRRPLWAMDAGEVRAHYAELDRRAKENPIERGAYLAHAAGCVTCHSTYDSSGQLVEELRLAGGMKWSLGPYGTVTSINLTPDKETGIGNWTDDELKRGMTRGIRKDGSRSIPFPMPWTSLANLSGEDLAAIIAYLRSLPPVANKIPPPEPLGMFSYLWAKFKMLILHEDFASNLYPGNAGSAGKGAAR